MRSEFLTQRGSGPAPTASSSRVMVGPLGDASRLEPGDHIDELLTGFVTLADHDLHGAYLPRVSHWSTLAIRRVAAPKNGPDAIPTKIAAGRFTGFSVRP
jgi:hypothetical protein